MNECYTSNAFWPEGLKKDKCEVRKSKDYHTSLEGAEIICDMLEKEGFSAEGKIFPIYTWIEKLKKVPKDSPEAILFTIIDNIDTASDALKPETTPYVKFVEKMVKEAQKIIISDGYELYYND